MYLGRRKVKNVGFESGLDKAPPILEEGLKEQLTYRLRMGTILPQEKQKLIEGHIGLAISIVGRYIEKQPYKGKDAAGEAFLAVCEAVEKFPSVAENNCITPYIVTTIHSKVSKFLIEDQTVRIPKGEMNLRAHDFRKNGKNNLQTYTPFDTKLHGETESDDLSGSLLAEVLVKIRFSRGEKAFINLKLAGNTEADIARELGLTRSVVSKRMKLLRAKIFRYVDPDIQRKVWMFL